MKEIRNGANKLVCCVDQQQKAVEIVVKGYKTVIRFSDDGKMIVDNTKIAA